MGETAIEHISAGAIVYYDNRNKIYALAMYRKAADTWHLPKGTVKAGESLKQGAEREILEETGFSVNVIGYLNFLNSVIVKDGKIIPKKTYYFIAKPKKDTLVKQHDSEHDDVVFMEINKLIKLIRQKQIPGYEKEYLILEQFLKSGVLSLV